MGQRLPQRIGLAQRIDRRAAEGPRVFRSPIHRRVPGVRFLAFAIASVLGAGVAFTPPIVFVLLILRVGGIPVGAAVPLAFVPLTLTGFCMHWVGVAVDRAWKLRTKWGQLSIGRDGLSWDGWLVRSFLPWTAIAGTTALKDALRVARHRGRAFVVGLPAPTEVETKLAAALEAASTEPLEVPVGLAKASPDAWLEAVRAMSRDDYRGGVPTDVLVRVLEHPSSPPLARVGAARALATRDANRVRVVIEDLADEETANALEAALVGDPSPATIRRLAARS